MSPDPTFIEWWFGKVRRFNWSWPLRGTILNPLPTAQEYPLPGSPFNFEVKEKRPCCPDCYDPSCRDCKPFAVEGVGNEKIGPEPAFDSLEPSEVPK